MKIQEKIRFMRELKNCSQEELAEKLGMSTYGYAKIERGETKATIPKLEQIAEALEIDMMELLTFGEKNVACLIGDNNQNHQDSTHIIKSETETSFELQKQQLIIEHLQTLLAQKEKENEYLQELLAMQKRLQQQQKQE
ncbi:helix-turn-helix domain-containing protein [Methylomicrobium agile]|uniref:helix-turn-helix domain-containing protein n=1 Tax=Methylomicrobium agile TaxID=39774 RepID=UPI0004DF342A|nr:helix-turn-helix transcriptional regulator [Methylomicrobium agile]